jgi:hypothetical protein
MSKVRIPIEKLIDASNQGSDQGIGLRCPRCRAPQFKQSGRGVRRTLQTSEGEVRRDRECRVCGYRFSTFER